MKFLVVFATFAILLGVASCTIKCPLYPVNANCFANPCQTNPCLAGQTCCADYSSGCNRHCLGCPTYPANVACLVSPCQSNPCASGTCCEDYSKGCDYHCF